MKARRDKYQRQVHKHKSLLNKSVSASLLYHNDPAGPPPQIDGFLGQQSPSMSLLRTLSLHKSGQPTVAIVKNGSSGDRDSASRVDIVRLNGAFVVIVQFKNRERETSPNTRLCNKTYCQRQRPERALLWVGQHEVVSFLHLIQCNFKDTSRK